MPSRGHDTRRRPPARDLRREVRDRAAAAVPDAIAALVGAIGSLAARPDAGGGAVLLDSLGGAVSRVATDATAFPHDAFAVVQLLASWDAGATAAVVDTTRAWLGDLYVAARPLIGRGAYVNYVDADLDDWPQAYFGGNYARLQSVKTRYDSQRVFDFPQAVRPSA